MVNDSIVAPKEGDEILPWARSVTEGVNSFRVFGTKKLVRQGPGGFSLEDLPPNKREVSFSALAIRGGGRFEAAIDPDTGAVTLANCYYRIGGKTYSLGSSTPQVPAAGEIWALKISIYSATPSATIARYAALGALQTAERDPDYFIAPLYEFEADPEDASRCVIKCDFRIGPDAAMGEFAS